MEKSIEMLASLSELSSKTTFDTLIEASKGIYETLANLLIVIYIFIW